MSPSIGDTWELPKDFVLTFSAHAIRAMLKRRVESEDVRQALRSTQILESFPASGYPFPNYLLLASMRQRPVHIVIAEKLELKEIQIVTVYQPDELRWEEGFKRRK